MTTFVSIDDDILGVNAPGYVYEDDDVEVTIGAGTTVHSDTRDAIVSDHDDSRLINNGHVLSDAGGDVAVDLGGANAAITNNAGAVINGFHSGVWANSGSFDDPASVTIVNYGEIRGQSFQGVMFSFSSAGNELSNHGLITGGHAEVGGSARAGSTVINNFGVISSDEYGVLIGSGSADVINTINNEAGGKIIGLEAAIAVPSGGQISLKNKGKVVGDIDCDADGRGDKVVNKGKINGVIDLGSGEDEFVFAGGKQGKVRGEEGADKFIFKKDLASQKNVAKIGDFSPGEDTIALSRGLFKGIGDKLSKKEFEVGKNADDGKDHIVYNEDKGKIYYDEDGKGGAGKELFAKVSKGTELDHHDFFVV